MPFLTAKDVSVELSIPLARVYELTRCRRLPAVRLGERQLRYDPEAIRDWAAHGGVAECHPPDDVHEVEVDHGSK